MYKNETGRSLTEMLGVLAVIGVLSITAVLGLNYAIDKIQANHIYQDIKLVYMSFFNPSTHSSAWQSVSFNSHSQKKFFIQRDKAGNDFVRVVAVNSDVCDILSDLSEDSEEITLFGMDTLPLSCDMPEQDIIASFSGVLPIIVCAVGNDCPEIYNIYCDAQAKECKTCPWTQRANDSHDECIDLCGDRTDGYTLSCGSDETQENWCCPTNYMCSDQIGMCLDDTVCLYEIEPISVASYRTNCSYTITQNDITPLNDTCPEGYYCHVAWLDETWNEGNAKTISSADYTGTVYGVCTYMTVASATPIQEMEGGDIKEITGCKNKTHYCHVKWTDGTLSKSISTPDYTGKAYGKCVTMTSSTASADGIFQGITNFE